MMVYSYMFFLCFSFVSMKGSGLHAITDVKPFDELYADGIEAYWNENWEGCIHYLEEALTSYRLMKEVLKNCSIECTTNINQEATSVSFIINKAACLETCEKKRIGRPGVFSRISAEVLEEFKNKRPYVYLQFAYFRSGDFAKSLSVTYTYSLYNPDDDMMKKNMEYYRNHENSRAEMFVNNDVPPHIAAYDQAIEAYNAEDYDDAIRNFEEALTLFYDAQFECQALCEGEFDGGPEFLERKSFHDHAVDHYRLVLECYIACPNEAVRLSTNHYIKNFLPTQYEFLHYAYYGVQDFANSAKCLQSFLLFFSDNKLFNERKQLFENADDVSPREEAQQFSQRINLQVAMLKFIYQSFGIHDYNQDLLAVFSLEDDKPRKHKNDEDPFSTDYFGGYSSLEEKQLDIIESKDEYNEEMREIRIKKEKLNSNDMDDTDISHLLHTPIGQSTVDSKHLISISDRASVKEEPTAEGPILFSSELLANSTQMGGPLRFVLDSFATMDDCQLLIDLELTGGIMGDGYRGKSNPHTAHEVFHGITVYRAAVLAEKGKVPVAAARVYYDLSERVRQQVQAYFKLDQIYFDYTHLVCRTALNQGDDVTRDDNSHPIHGDNCILEGDGKCSKRSPAYTWRDYSAIMYLNSDFEGGHFVMTDHTARRVKVQVKPHCGRLVGFSAGKECLHGVKPVTRGRRCAMALWFTLDSSYDEEQRKEAKAILDRLSLKDEL